MVGACLMLCYNTSSTMNQSQWVAIALQCLVPTLSTCKPKLGAMEGPKSKIETPQVTNL